MFTTCLLIRYDLVSTRHKDKSKVLKAKIPSNKITLANFLTLFVKTSLLRRRRPFPMNLHHYAKSTLSVKWP